MNSPAKARLVKIVAESRISEAELRRALDELVDSGLVAFVNEVRRTREMEDVPQSNTNTKKSRRRESRSNLSPSDEVVRLLRDEAGFSSAESAALLLEALNIKELPQSMRFQEARKIPLGEWISRLGAFVPISQILHAATAIRNSKVHNKVSAWPLKR
jgi:hypothetical protein